MKYLLQRLQSKHAYEAAQFTRRDSCKVHLISSFSPHSLIVVTDLLKPKLNNYRAVINECFLCPQAHMAGPG